MEHTFQGGLVRIGRCPIKRKVLNNKDKFTIVQEFTGVLSENADGKSFRFVLKGTFKSDVGGDWGKPDVRYKWTATITPQAKTINASIRSIL